jgi:hypothetical protein
MGAETHHIHRSLFKISSFYFSVPTTHRISPSLSSSIWTIQLDNKMTYYQSGGPAYGGEYMITTYVHVGSFFERFKFAKVPIDSWAPLSAVNVYLYDMINV